MESVVGSFAYGAGRLHLVEGTAYIKVWGILKWPIWDHLRSEDYFQAKGCVTGQEVEDGSKSKIVKVLLAIALILSLF